MTDEEKKDELEGLISGEIKPEDKPESEPEPSEGNSEDSQERQQASPLFGVVIIYDPVKHSIKIQDKPDNIIALGMVETAALLIREQLASNVNQQSSNLVLPRRLKKH